MSEPLTLERDGGDWPNRAASRLVPSGGLTWHVQRMGAGPVVLLLHGTGASTHSFAALMPRLARHFDVVAMDLPGHAMTHGAPRAVFTLPGMAKAIAGLLQAIGAQPHLAVGHSAGAAIAIRMCLDQYIAPAGVVGINGALLPFRGLASQFFSPLAKVLALNPLVPRLCAWRAADRQAVERLIRGTGSALDPRSLEFYARLFQNTAHVRGTLDMMAGWDLAALDRDLSRHTIPTLLIAGGNDSAVPPDDAFMVRDRMAKARVELMRCAGHLAHEERPDDVALIIETFAGQVGVLSAAAARDDKAHAARD